MVRETRHLWIGNLPYNIREDRILEHFKRYGKVQSVKLLSNNKDEDNAICATVAFIDIKSASKAHGAENKIEDRTLKTDYYEPPQPSTSSSAIFIHERDDSLVRPAAAGTYSSNRFTHRRQYHDDEVFPNHTSKSRDRYSRSSTASFQDISERSQSSRGRHFDSSTRLDNGRASRRSQHKPSRSNSCSPLAGSRSRSRSTSHSRSSSSSSSKVPSQNSSRSGSPSNKSSPYVDRKESRDRLLTNGDSVFFYSQSLKSRDDKKPVAICVRNLPVRSTDTSLKDGLYHEYKKHGKVTMVKVIGQAQDRYAVVCFKKPEDVEKALEVSKDKCFFGCRIEVTAHEGLDGDDNEFRPLEADLDEYHPKATRTLFIGNLEKEITPAELKKHFEQFGDIIEIDIKKQGTSSYAFIQYSNVSSVVKAMRKLDGENLGSNRMKLGFGKSMPTCCVWMDGVAESVTEKFLQRHFGRFGATKHLFIDRENGTALILYETTECAQVAISEMRGRVLGGMRLQVDYASRECQTSFLNKMENNGQIQPGDHRFLRDRRDFEFPREERYSRPDARPAFDSRFVRFDGQQRKNSFRGVHRGTTPSSTTTFKPNAMFQGHYDVSNYDEFGERRHSVSKTDEIVDGYEEEAVKKETIKVQKVKKITKIREAMNKPEIVRKYQPDVIMRGEAILIEKFKLGKLTNIDLMKAHELLPGPDPRVFREHFPPSIYAPIILNKSRSENWPAEYPLPKFALQSVKGKPQLCMPSPKTPVLPSTPLSNCNDLGSHSFAHPMVSTPLTLSTPSSMSHSLLMKKHLHDSSFDEDHMLTPMSKASKSHYHLGGLIEDDIMSPNMSSPSPISSPNCLSFEERIKALDEKFNTLSSSSGSSSKFKSSSSSFKSRSHLSLSTPDLLLEPSEIAKTLLAKSSILDQDFKRLEYMTESYEPKEFTKGGEVLSPKSKPLFRTKAAAKEFSLPILQSKSSCAASPSPAVPISPAPPLLGPEPPTHTEEESGDLRNVETSYKLLESIMPPVLHREVPYSVLKPTSSHLTNSETSNLISETLIKQEPLFDTSLEPSTLLSDIKLEKEPKNGSSDFWTTSKVDDFLEPKSLSKKMKTSIKTEFSDLIMLREEKSHLYHRDRHSSESKIDSSSQKHESSSKSKSKSHKKRSRSGGEKSEKSHRSKVPKLNKAEETPYLSMYDMVKARSSHNQTKAKDQTKPESSRQRHSSSAKSHRTKGTKRSFSSSASDNDSLSDEDENNKMNFSSRSKNPRKRKAIIESSSEDEEENPFIPHTKVKKESKATSESSDLLGGESDDLPHDDIFSKHLSKQSSLNDKDFLDFSPSNSENILESITSKSFLHNQKSPNQNKYSSSLKLFEEENSSENSDSSSIHVPKERPKISKKNKLHKELEEERNKHNKVHHSSDDNMSPLVNNADNLKSASKSKSMESSFSNANIFTDSDLNFNLSSLDHFPQKESTDNFGFLMHKREEFDDIFSLPESTVVGTEENKTKRRFEEEAANQTRKLEEELYETWHDDDKLYSSDSPKDKKCDKENEFNELVIDQSAELKLHSPEYLSSNEQSVVRNSANVLEIENRRKIEEDLAVSALLQQMNEPEQLVQETTKETEYLENLLDNSYSDSTSFMISYESNLATEAISEKCTEKFQPEVQPEEIAPKEEEYEFLKVPEEKEAVEEVAEPTIAPQDLNVLKPEELEEKEHSSQLDLYENDQVSNDLYETSKEKLDEPPPLLEPINLYPAPNTSLDKDLDSQTSLDNYPFNSPLNNSTPPSLPPCETNDNEYESFAPTKGATPPPTPKYDRHIFSDLSTVYNYSQTVFKESLAAYQQETKVDQAQNKPIELSISSLSESLPFEITSQKEEKIKEDIEPTDFPIQPFVPEDEPKEDIIETKESSDLAHGSESTEPNTPSHYEFNEVSPNHDSEEQLNPIVRYPNNDNHLIDKPIIDEEPPISTPSKESKEFTPEPSEEPDNVFDSFSSPKMPSSPMIHDSISEHELSKSLEESDDPKEEQMIPYEKIEFHAEEDDNTRTSFEDDALHKTTEDEQNKDELSTKDQSIESTNSNQAFDSKNNAEVNNGEQPVATNIEETNEPQQEDTKTVEEVHYDRPRRGRRPKSKPRLTSPTTLRESTYLRSGSRRTQSPAATRRNLRSDKNAVLEKPISKPLEYCGSSRKSHQKAKTEEPKEIPEPVPLKETISSEKENDITPSDFNQTPLAKTEEKKRRGRRRKTADDLCPDTKIEENKNPKVTALGSDAKLQFNKENAYDVFEFRDSDDDDMSFEVKDRLHDSKNSSHESKDLDVSHTEKKPEEPPKPKVVEEKEYVTEHIQHPKISITIRFAKNDAGTENPSIAKSTEPIVEVVEKPKVEESSKTRKSQRLESNKNHEPKVVREPTPEPQLPIPPVNKTSVDDVIDEVVKGNFDLTPAPPSSPPPVTETRSSRRLRSNRFKGGENNSAEAELDKNKPVFVIPDNTVKDIPEPTVVQPESVPSKSTSLRSFRITRSSLKAEAAITTINKEPLLPVVETTPPLPKEPPAVVIKELIVNKEPASPVREQLAVNKEQAVEIPLVTKEAPVSVEPQVPEPKYERSSPLPLIKTEVPKPLLLESKDIKEERRSPIVLLDPVTGYLTPIPKVEPPIDEKYNLAMCKLPLKSPGISLPMSVINSPLPNKLEPPPPTHSTPKSSHYMDMPDHHFRKRPIKIPETFQHPSVARFVNNNLHSSDPRSGSLVYPPIDSIQSEHGAALKMGVPPQFIYHPIPSVPSEYGIHESKLPLPANINVDKEEVERKSPRDLKHIKLKEECGLYHHNRTERITDSPVVANLYMQKEEHHHHHPHHPNSSSFPPTNKLLLPGYLDSPTLLKTKHQQPLSQQDYKKLPPPRPGRGSNYFAPQMGTEAPLNLPSPAGHNAMLHPQTPPHASQVPQQGDSLLLQRYPVMWQGLLALKNDQAAVQMHFVSGNTQIGPASLPPMAEGGTPPLRIAQRMRLEQVQLDGVARKMQQVDEHCILLALPCGRDHMDVLQQSNNLRNGIINYLQLKQAAGIVNAPAPGSIQPAYVIHIFPSCEFSNENMARIAPDLLHSVNDIAHLLIIIATV